MQYKTIDISKEASKLRTRAYNSTGSWICERLKFELWFFYNRELNGKVGKYVNALKNEIQNQRFTFQTDPLDAARNDEDGFRL